MVHEFLIPALEAVAAEVLAQLPTSARSSGDAGVELPHLPSVEAVLRSQPRPATFTHLHPPRPTANTLYRSFLLRPASMTSLYREAIGRLTLISTVTHDELSRLE